jgi:hypothetical protein
MEQVKDVLRTLFRPDDRFRRVRATKRHSRDVDLERRSAGIGRPSLGRDNQQRQTPRRRLPTRAQEDDLRQHAGNVLPGTVRFKPLSDS